MVFRQYLINDPRLQVVATKSTNIYYCAVDMHIWTTQALLGCFKSNESRHQVPFLPKSKYYGTDQYLYMGKHTCIPTGCHIRALGGILHEDKMSVSQ